MPERVGPQRPAGHGGDLVAAQDAFLDTGTPEILSIFPAAPQEMQTAVVIRGNNFQVGQTVLYAGITVSVQGVSQGTGPSGEDEITCTWPRIALPGGDLPFNTFLNLTVGASVAFPVQTAPFYEYGLTQPKAAIRTADPGFWDDDTLVIGTDSFYAQQVLPAEVDSNLLPEGFLNSLPGTIIAGGVPSFTFDYMLWDATSGTWSNIATETIYQGAASSITLAGSSDATFNGREITLAALNLAGSAILSADGRLVTEGALAFIGGSQLSLNGRLQADVPGQITFAGSSAFSSAPRQTLQSSISFAGGSQLALSPGLQNAAVLLAGSSDLLLDGRLIAAGGLLFQGASALALTPRLDVNLRTSVAFDGASDLGLTSVLVGGARVAFGGTSTLTADSRQIQRANVSFDGVSLLRLNGIIPGNDIGDIDVPGVISQTDRKGITSRHNW